MLLFEGVSATRRTDYPTRGVDKIVVVKRHAPAVQVLRTGCARVFPAAEVTHYHGAIPGLDALRAIPADLLVCGLNLSDYDGLDLLRLVELEGLARRTLIATDRRDDRVAHFLSTVMGRASFVDWQQSDGDALAGVLRRVWLGERVMDAVLRGAAHGRRRDPGYYPLVLTEMEAEVLAALAALGDIEAVAALRGTRPGTVHTQRKRIMFKLGLHSQADLVVYAACRGLVRYDAGRILRPGYQWRDLAREGAAAR